MNYDDVVARRAEMHRARIAIREAKEQRPVRTRPRDPEERAILIRLTALRWERALASGKVERLGPREYRLRIGGADRVE